MRQFIPFLIIVISVLSSNIALADCTPNNPEPFNTFFSKWSDNKQFSNTRTIYPLKTIKYEYGLEKPTPIYGKVSKSEDENGKPLSEHIKANSMSYKIISVKSQKANVSVFKEGSDWGYEYHFLNQKGCWYLYEFENKSL